MTQVTLFIGPVDFYYKDQHGTTIRCEMSTGDSNFISPFVPHSFTTRDNNVDAIIVAVTYGGCVRRAFTEFSRVGSKQVFSLAGDKRDPQLARRCVLQRHLDAECMTHEDLAQAVEPSMAPARVAELLEGKEGSPAELEILACALHVRLSDLYVCAMESHEEVVVTSSGQSQAQARRLGTYTLAPLARTRHQPDLKTFDLEVLDSATPGVPLRCGLHTFLYNFGAEAVELSWQGCDQGHSTCFRPGDSAYVAPLVEHRFSVITEQLSCSSNGGDSSNSSGNPNGHACGRGRRLFVVRIPGHLTGETLSEFATFSAHGRERVGAETMQWYS